MSFRKSVRQSFEAQKSKVHAKKAHYLAGRPHRSFRLTRKEDYKKEHPAPGYIKFIFQVFGVIKKNRKVFFRLLLVSALASVVLVGIMSQDRYESLDEAMDETSEEVVAGNFSGFGKTTMLFITTVATGGLNQNPTEPQQIFNVFIMILICLATIWVLRQRFAGNDVRMKDALYNAFGPLVSIALIFILLLIQLIPFFIAFIVYSSAVETDFLSNGFYALFFWIAVGGLGLLSIYLMVPTVIAIIAATAPGLYPMQALHNAGELVLGKRFKIIFRFIWGLIGILPVWIIVILPAIMIDSFLKGVSDFFLGWPIVPVAFLLTSLFSVLYFSAYLYMYYRRLLDEFEPRNS
ncbi:MAG: hypothetical protein LBE03_01725 [Candidatus Nomurabacteria bacterium]|jgi:hypothetical protein|nr:hypothetical protein [Candidatus Nomurabacteria bacterium]